MLSSSVCTNSPNIRRCTDIKLSTDRKLSKQENQPNKVRACSLNHTDKTLAYFILTVITTFHVFNRTTKGNKIDTGLTHRNNFASLRNRRPTFLKPLRCVETSEDRLPVDAVPYPSRSNTPAETPDLADLHPCRCGERFDPPTGDILS